MISDRLKLRRELLHMNQKELATKINVSPSTIGMYEQGRRAPDSNVLVRLANVLNCSTDYLLGRVKDPQTKIIKKEDLPEDLAPYVDYIEILKEYDLSDISPEGLKRLIEAAKDFNKKIEKE